MSISSLRTVSLLFICTGVLHALISKQSSFYYFVRSQIPLYAVIPVVGLSFLLGRNFDALFRPESLKDGCAREANRHVEISSSGVKYGHQTPGENISQQQQRHQQDPKHIKAKSHKFQLVHKLDNEVKKIEQKAKQYTDKIHWNSNHKNKFLSNVTFLDSKYCTKPPAKIRLSNELMRHLLTFADFSKKSTAAPVDAESSDLQEAVVINESMLPSGQITIGHAILKNSKEASFEDEGFSYIVDPMCPLRGMDLFVADDPERQIWRQPLLTESGLRETPTFIINLMMPFGNITVYMQMPQWFDNWDDIPEQKEEDKPDVKTFKRFLDEDDEYRNTHTKLVPFIVDGPMAIRLIKPKPQEFHMSGIRHPVSWHKVNRSIDSKTGKVSSALLECDVDLVSNPAMRKVCSMVRPHLSKITIDIALIVSKPTDSEVDEPSACIGMWRIDKVDFESCAVFPHKSVEEVAEEMKSFIALEAEEVQVVSR